MSFSSMQRFQDFAYQSSSPSVIVSAQILYFMPNLTNLR